MSKLRRRIDEQGYVVVPGVVPRKNVDAVVADIWRHTGADPADRSTWYAPDRIGPAGMVEMYHYQSMWDTRQDERVHEVFAEIFGSERLWVSIDRTNLKPPSVPEYPDYHHRGFLHWDADIERYPDIPFGVQGVLALADTSEDMGGFQCVPSIYQNLPAYLEKYGRSRQADLTEHTPVQVPLRAGDMVIWTSLLAHGNGDNLTDRPRLAQYISMNPARETDDQARQARIDAWQENRPLAHHRAFPGDPRGIEAARGRPAELTSLGRRLLGLDRW
ncbi:Phytanoyl-CoA dioxygenase (PhyH) [Actinopolymorpha cephalotaxi]|uniref:Phytanoyl-CoA dioxygenase (PhyH) n=1 Tax=Actinopolymorpha cephalotaxi TaxID=504797 RepID=A0A1I2LW42_9ACTN|nr:phytanoyl-CoA dioxygenase family protein [Actinopolymorpha cephalotaxi]NYH81391.1 hypothetical protein [Actinopolymorpha cephalotaxi]SFF81211.1 Phytanoyl-CoA dioxygenase (PhyH) [Actinopolymorpha cephalotaxi]